MKTFNEVYKPKAKDEQRFVDKHVTIKHQDRNGNDDSVFNASKVKYSKRKGHHGYDPGDDEKVYEDFEESFLAPGVHSELKSMPKDAIKRTYATYQATAKNFKKNGSHALAAHALGAANEIKRKYLNEDQIDEASVHKQNYSWGRMVTVRDRNSNTYPLHPEHQKIIKNLKHGQKASFKDETGRFVHAYRENDKVHLKNNGSNRKVSIDHSHFDEEHINEISKKTLGNYIRGAVVDRDRKMDNAQQSAKLARLSDDDPNFKKKMLRKSGEFAWKAAKRKMGISQAVDKLTKEEVDEITEKYIVHMTKNGKPADKVKISAIDQQNAEYQAKKLAGSKPFRGYELHKVVKEEQIDELSRKTLGSYIRQSADDLHTHGRLSVIHDTGQPKLNKKARYHYAKAAQRQKGINIASRKLAKEEQEELSFEDIIFEKVEHLPENIVQDIFDLYNQLNETNQQILVEKCETEEGVNEIINFIINKR